jgi:hypothetical protein
MSLLIRSQIIIIRPTIRCCTISVLKASWSNKRIKIEEGRNFPSSHDLNGDASPGYPDWGMPLFVQFHKAITGLVTYNIILLLPHRSQLTVIRGPTWNGKHAAACLMYYATRQKAAGSITDEVIGNLSWPNPSGLTMALGSTHPLTEMSIRKLSGG